MAHARRRPGYGQLGRGPDRGGPAAARERWPSQGPKRLELAGKGLNRPRTNLFRPRKARIAICWPAGVNSGQKTYMPAGEMSELIPTPHMSAGT
jgi:hypothetical protein